MNWSARFSWMMALRAGCEPRASGGDDTDMADMGTAFGLDASFDALPSNASSQAMTASPPSLASTLESRLIRRSRL